MSLRQLLNRPSLVLFVCLFASQAGLLVLSPILPEVARAFPGRFACAVLYPEAARALAVKFGFRRWPAIVLLKDGGYVGAIDGLRNWDEYLEEMQQLLAAEPTRAPSIGIAVKTSGNAGPCH